MLPVAAASRTRDAATTVQFCVSNHLKELIPTAFFINSVRSQAPPAALIKD